MNKAIQQRSYRTGLETLAILERLEKKHNLFAHKFEGYSAWRLLRFKAATEIQSLPMEVKPDSLTWDWLKERILLFLPDLVKFISPRRSRYVFKTFSSALRELRNGQYVDIYFDDILQKAEEGFKIETLNSITYHHRRKQALFPVAMTTSFVDLFSMLLSYLNLPKKNDALICQIEREIGEEPALRELNGTRIGRTLRRFYWSKWLYTSLLRRIRPSFVMTADQNEYAMWAAANHLGIPTLEFQHGLFPRHDPDGALPAVGEDEREEMIVPRRILIYGDYWLNELKRSPFYTDELVVVGSPLIDTYRKKRAEFVQKNGNTFVTILVTTQGIDRERLIEFILKFLASAQGKLKYQLYIKLHPGFEKDKRAYENPLKGYPNVNILLGAEDPSTYELQCMADFHVSISSASHYDALGIGVPTIILPLASCEEVLHLDDSGHAKVARTPEELLDIVLNDRGAGVPPEISAYYYAPNALENIFRVMKSFSQET